MEAEHHHTPHMGHRTGAFNRASSGCDPSAQTRQSMGHKGHKNQRKICLSLARLTIEQWIPSSIVMKVHVDHFLFRLLNRPFPRVA
jgi:hypothetical protein